MIEQPNTKTDQPGDRSVPFKRWWNVRDLGGLPTRSGGTTRPGVLFRGATPQYATGTDIDEALRRNLTRFVDLRRRRSEEDWRNRTPGVGWSHVNLLASITGPRDGSIAQLLRALLDRARREVAAAIREITEMTQDGPVVFHCYTGKDRTGLVAIVLLALADVRRDSIIDDYMASNPEFEAMRRHVVAETGPAFMAGAPAAMRGGVEREAAEQALNFLEAEGGAAAYLESGGLSAVEITETAALLR